MLPKLSDVPPALLTTLGASAMHGLKEHGYLEPRLPAKARATPEGEKKPGTNAPTYASRYVGVTRAKGRWVAAWGPRGAQHTGPHRELTDQGERWAAQDRARSVGFEYLELRDGTRIEYLWKAYEEMMG